MSTKYPVLDNRPIDQWRVTELKEELKRRRLITRGLKDDLIKRLDEALRNERISNEEEEALHKVGDTDTTVVEHAVDLVTTLNNDEEATHAKRESNEEKETFHNEGDSKKEEVANGSGFDLEHEVKCEDAVTTPIKTDIVEDTSDHNQNQNGVADGKTAAVDVDVNPSMLCQGKFEDVESNIANDSVVVVDESVVVATSVEVNVAISQSLVTEMSSSNQSPSKESQVENEDPKPCLGDAVLKITSSNDQVSEVSPVLGSQVRFESISSESVSINEKNELKDNLNADNFHLELEVIKPEMVQPSSSNVSPKGGDLHPLDGPEPHENQRHVGELDDINAPNVDIQRGNHSAEGGSPEKLNLDRSSGDDSMEEDVVEKHVDSIHNSDEVGDKSKERDVKEESPVDVVEGGLSSQKDVPAEHKSHEAAAAAQKRKFEVQGVAGNHEPPKRRRWNLETLKAPELQTSNVTPATTPKDASPSIHKSNFTRSNSTLSGGDAPKERVVPPSSKPPTNSLRIDHFLRPFTLKAVQELLAKTGTVCNFWMDHIKTHCFVTYSSVEEAIETRNALYNLQWPTNGGRLLVAEFVDPQEVKMRVEAPSQSPAAPVSTGPSPHTAHPPSQPQPTSRQQVPRQQLPPAPPLPPPQQRSDQPSPRDRLPLPPPPPLSKKPDPPIVTLDDLFRKTKAAPRIYYLPLSDEHVSAKLAAQGRNK